MTHKAKESKIFISCEATANGVVNSLNLIVDGVEYPFKRNTNYSSIYELTIEIAVSENSNSLSFIVSGTSLRKNFSHAEGSILFTIDAMNFGNYSFRSEISGGLFSAHLMTFPIIDRKVTKPFEPLEASVLDNLELDSYNQEAHTIDFDSYNMPLGSSSSKAMTESGGSKTQNINNSVSSNHNSIKKDPGGEVVIFYGTNRTKNEKAKEHSKDYYGDEIGDMEVGTCTISIPPGHKQGALERPGKILWLWELSENAAKHITLKTLAPKNQSDFFAYLNQGLAGTEEKAALIFVHGFNVTFAEAAWRTGQLCYDIPFNGITGLFSWPSTGATQDYFRDGERADASVSLLEKFIEDIATNTSVKQLHFIAHSMGSRILTRALTKLLDKQSFINSLTTISQVVLAAPDIDRDVFKSEILPQFKKVGTGRTVYMNDKDMALRLSRTFRTGLSRLGESGESIFVDDGIDSIDTSNVMTEGIHHNYMFEAKELLSDLYLLLCKGLKPGDRRLRKVPEGAPTHWMFRE